MYTNISGDSTATIPGTGGLQFQPGSTTSHFDRIYGHPNGQWALTAFNNQATTADEFIFANNQVIITEGDVAQWAAGTELVGAFDTALGINKWGDMAFANNTDADTGADEYVVKYDGSDFIAVAAEGQPVAAIPGANWESTLESVRISDDGQVGFVADAV